MFERSKFCNKCLCVVAFGVRNELQLVVGER